MSDAFGHDDDPAAVEASRDEAILDELAELGLELARGLQARALAAEAADAAAGLAMAFQRVARTVRQCLALKGKLARDELQMDREMHRDAGIEIARRIRKRKAWVRMHLERAIAEQTPEGEVDLACSRLEDLRERLDDEVLDESFLAGDIADVIADLHRQLGLRPPAPTAEDLDEGDPGDDGPVDDAALSDPAEADLTPPEPWRAGGRLAPPIDPPSWETG